ncbi:MAG: restriction endonuclease [Proteobacteria bacterium]|nr:restriction endonuclease [Pseudomonadota bacterium]
MSRSTEDILPPRPEVNPRLYAYTIDMPSHAGLLKIGQTTRDVKQRVAEQTKTAGITPRIELDEPATRDDGSIISDHALRDALKAKGHERVQLEWMRCTVADVHASLHQLRTGQIVSGARDQSFPPRAEQQTAVDATYAYFQSRWAEDEAAVTRLLWNAKMRFGKTFTAYQLARKLEAKRVLVVTFKPAVEDAWQADLEGHVDFEGWQYLSRASGRDPRDADKDRPLVYFGSFQDLLGREAGTGAIKPKDEWLHTPPWDLVIFDEYHFGAWRETAKELFEGDEEAITRQETLLKKAEETKVAAEALAERIADLQQPLEVEADFLPITSRAYLYLSGTPFKALATGEFIEDQIFNWTYTDEQRAKAEFVKAHPGERNPYAALPEMRLLTYQMPAELLAIAGGGEFDEFDLNTFFAGTGTGADATFTHKDDVQKWLQVIRGEHAPGDALKSGARPPWPYADSQLLPWLNHAFWFLPNVAACEAMRNLLAEPQNVFWHDYRVVMVAGANAGIGLSAVPPVRSAIGEGFKTKTITLSCGKLTTGVTIPQWSSILMLRNLKSPETYFQAAFRVQSPWSIRNPEGDDPNREQVVKPVCFVFDFAPTRALRQLSSYGIGLSPEAPSQEQAVADLISFLPVLAYNGAFMQPVDAGEILDYAMAGTTGTLLARKWESALLVNVDNDTLSRILESKEAMAAVERIEGWRNLGDNIIETIIAKSEAVKDLKKKAREGELSEKEKRELTDEEKEYKSLRKKVQEKLIKFATRIPVFMYLTDFRENKLQEVITQIEPELFQTVTGLTVGDFRMLVDLRVFNTERMNQAVIAFRQYENASLSYTGIDSHPGLTLIGLYDTVVAKE